jgi:antitoxin (DNA-binding transcriptional repressor) of toxin-antitoxin stability system
MRFVSVRDLRSKSAELWRDLPAEGEMIVTSNGRPVAILAAVDEASVEESLDAFRQTRAREALESIQLGSVAAGLDRLTAEEIDREIVAARRSRRSG